MPCGIQSPCEVCVHMYSCMCFACNFYYCLIKALWKPSTVLMEIIFYILFKSLFLAHLLLFFALCPSVLERFWLFIRIFQDFFQRFLSLCVQRLNFNYNLYQHLLKEVLFINKHCGFSHNYSVGKSFSSRCLVLQLGCELVCLIRGLCVLGCLPLKTLKQFKVLQLWVGGYF